MANQSVEVVKFNDQDFLLVFNVNVGKLPPRKAEAFLQKVAKKYKDIVEKAFPSLHIEIMTVPATNS